MNKSVLFQIIGTVRGVQIGAGLIYVCVYMCVWMYMCHNNSTTTKNEMWVELVHCHFTLSEKVMGHSYASIIL